MGKRKKRGLPSMLFWSKGEQRRFIDNVERFSSLVNDLERILTPAKRRSEAARKAQATKLANAQPASSPAADE